MGAVAVVELVDGMTLIQQSHTMDQDRLAEHIGEGLAGGGLRMDEATTFAADSMVPRETDGVIALIPTHMIRLVSVHADDEDDTDDEENDE